MPFAIRFPLLTLLILVASWGQDSQSLVQSFRGQALILRRIGDKQESKFKKDAWPRVHDGCDYAVFVREAAWSSDKVRLRLEGIGLLRLSQKPVRGCAQFVEDYTVEIGFPHDEPQESLAALLHDVLQTPEQYMASNGIVPAPPSTGQTAAQSLLTVMPAFPVAARQEHTSGSVDLEFQIGVDGRVHELHVVKGVSPVLDRRAFLAVFLRRYQPAMAQGKPMSTSETASIAFTLSQ